MSEPLLSQAVSVALSMAQLGAAVWRSMDEAERALAAFSAAQGWSLVVRKSGKHHFTFIDAHGEERHGQTELNKMWICSRGHGRRANDQHQCAAAESDQPAVCEAVNATGQLSPPSVQLPRLAASTKTGCPVFIRVGMLKRATPSNGKNWTEEDTPCAGYKIVSPASQLLPCNHNHSSAQATEDSPNVTETVADIPADVRAEVTSLVLAGFPSYQIRTFIVKKHNLPSLVPAVWTSLVRSIKVELGIQDAGQDLKALIERFTKERNESGAVFDFAVDGDLAVSAIFFMSRAMLESFRRCAQFAVNPGDGQHLQDEPLRHESVPRLRGGRAPTHLTVRLCLHEGGDATFLRVRADATEARGGAGRLAATVVRGDGRMRSHDIRIEEGGTPCRAAAMCVAPATKHHQAHRQQSSAPHQGMVQMCLRKDSSAVRCTLAGASAG
jgi:hypothetical protein